MIRYTSRMALAGEVERLTGRRLQVYNTIRLWNPAVDGPGPSIADIANKAGIKECTVCGRINELRDAGAIIEGPLKVSAETGKQVMTYIALGFNEPEIRGQTTFVL